MSSFGLKLNMKLSQQLRMTPQLQQAIKLLQLSRMELQSTVRKELIENPVLEEQHETIEVETKPSEPEVKDLVKETSDNENKIKDDMSVQDPQKQDEFDWDNYAENSTKLPSASYQSDEVMNYENIVSAKETLHDHLKWQLGMSGFNEEEYIIASILVNYIDENGYIKTPLEEIAEGEEGLTAEDLEEILPFVQEFDPAGVGARNLKECLLLQAKVLEEDTNDLVEVINNHLDDLQKKKYTAIAKVMGKDADYIQDLCQIIYSMDPKPGRAYVTTDTHFITPDVYVYKVGDEYVISLNEDGLPKLRISNLYKNILTADKASGDKKTEKESKTHEYIQDKLRSAVWLIKSIQKRQNTIYKVTESIVKHQKDFFEKGPAFIKPMILRDIASDIEMHESTVSRVTTAKYVHTPLGIYELKYFFNSGLSKTDGNSVASESVKLKIQSLVDEEDPRKPLSDQKIVDLLKKDGIKIARRTIAKYRDMLKILPSSKRKEYY